MTSPDRFTIACVHGGPRLEFTGKIPRGLTGHDGWSCIVKLSGGALTAFVEAYDIQPQRWSALFVALADSWRGWSGERCHESLEHHVKLIWTFDRTEHIRCRVRLQGGAVEDQWLAEENLHLEAGQLALLAHAAVTYFGPEPAGV